MLNIYDPTLFYLIGLLRDGSVYRYKRNYTIVWYSNNKEFLKKEVCTRLQQLGIKKSCEPYRYKEGHYRVRIYSKTLYNIIVIDFEHPINVGRKTRQFPWKTPTKVKLAPLELQTQYVKGFIDAEGSVIVSKTGIQIDISQSTRESLEFIREILIKLGIIPSGIYKGQDGIWRLRIASKNSLLNFVRLVSFRHPSKKEKLSYLLGSYLMP